MFRLASLVCSGCNHFGKTRCFYDNEKKRPCFSECGHSICLECTKTFTDCPVCQKPIVLRENYAARLLYEEYKNDPMEVFKNWWNSKVGGKETCTGCSDPCKTLRVCVTCDAKRLQHVMIFAEPDKEKSWMQTEEKRERRKQLENLDMPLIYSERDPDENSDEMNLKLILGCDYYMYANLGRCSSCLLDHHKGHLINTLEELAELMDLFTQNASLIATGFLSTELSRITGKCAIKTMRMRRTCEKISHFANFYFRSENTKMRPPDFHSRKKSIVSSFFEFLPFTNDDNVQREDVDKLLMSLENQLKNLDCIEGCTCTEILKQMHEMSFGNQIERTFVDIVQGIESDDLSKCPFPYKDFENIQKNANQLFKTKLYLISTVFCWNKKEKRICGLFNSTNRKPYKCPECKTTVCSKCAGNEIMCQSASCGMKLLVGNDVDITLTVDTETQDLVQYYKDNCLDLFQDWWNAEPSEIGYCMNCRSYSNQLEVCVFCESHEKNSALETRGKMRDIVEKNHENLLFFNYKGLKKFSMRWQCADCENRLQEEWVHKNEKSNVDSNNKWKRGCNHPGGHLYCWKIPSKCERVSIALKDIGNYEIAMKVATGEFIFSILKAGIEEKVRCRLRRMQFLKVYGILKTATNFYFRNMIAGRKTEELEEKAHKILATIETLRTKWSSYKPEGKECPCNAIWNKADKLSRKTFLKYLNIHSKGISDECPLTLNQEILKGVEELDEEFDFDWEIFVS